MTTLSRPELQRLTDAHTPPCLSLYFPAIRKDDTIQNQIRFKNLVSRAEDQLLKQGQRKSDVQRLLRPAQELLKDGLVWDHLDQGAAVFLAEGFFEIYSLPYPVVETAIVNRRFHLKPLLSLLTDHGRFFLLTVSRSQNRLYEGSRHSLREIPVQNMPKGIAETLQYEERQNESHTRAASVTRGARSPQGVAAAAVHGREIDKVDKGDVKRYFARVDAAVHETLRDETAPLIVATVEYEIPIYRDANTYPYLADGGLAARVESLGTSELHERAWTVVEPYFRRDLDAALERYRALRNTPKTSDDLAAILNAAQDGRIQSLFVSRERAAWGVYEPTSRETHLHPEKQPGDEDLLDLAGLKSLATGGRVYELPADRMPEAALVGAVFRY